MTTDRIYSQPLSRIGQFEFDDQVASVFPDMIARSVPGYASILAMIEQFAAKYAVPGTDIYDLGCSLGAATFAMRRGAPADCTIHAVDSSAAMMARLRDALDRVPDSGCAVELHESDIRDVQIRNASLVVLNLTLQFLPPSQRQPLLQKAVDGMRPGAALVLSEKICFDDPAEQQLMTGLHHEFKRAHGYSDLEIAQKRTAIENRLIPETLQTHILRLHAVGLQTAMLWFQCLNFASIVAVK
ncbi:MAG: carboxy-S-adenosyl-L-methionine synthase CmoA [Planctomycetaceae bacterium]